MMSNSSSSGGLGLCGVLTIIFIVLKLVGVITWSWVWVLSPLWIGLIAGVALLLVVLGIGVLITGSKKR